MEEVKLNRTNKRPLAFYGEEIARASNKQQCSTRWTNVRVFRVDQGGYVVGIGKLTCFMGERDQLVAEPLKTIKEAIAMIQREVPQLTCPIEIQLNQRAPWKKEAA
jgi:hypothetical protein